MDDSTPWRIAVAIATFRRNELLSALLDSLAVASRQHPLRVIVVDNDPAGPAAAVVDRDDLDITYAVEPTPGIVAARNKLLDLVRPDDDAVVFIDDDETVVPGWMRELVAAAKHYDADVVSGPVITRFPPDCPAWLVEGGYVQRPNPPSGSPLDHVRTGNTLVTTAVLRRAGNPRFDASFSETGGEDTEFFWHLQRLSTRMVWCAEAEAYEDHPPSRTSRRWVWRRGVRVANVRGRLLLRERSRLSVAAEGLLRLAHGLLMVVVVGVRTGRIRYPEFNRVTHGVGLLGAATGLFIREYRH